MRGYIISFLVLALIALSPTLVSSVQSNTTQTNVTFNGAFANGTAFYSNTYQVLNATIYARDAYPIEQCHTELYNRTIKNYSYVYVDTNKTRKQCHYETINATRTIKRSAYVNHTRVYTYENVTYQKKIVVCEQVPVLKRIRIYENMTTEETKKNIYMNYMRMFG